MAQLGKRGGSIGKHGDSIGKRGGSIGKRGGSIGKRGGSIGKHGDSIGKRGGSIREAWWLNGSTPDCCPAVPGSNPASLQPTADCQSSGGLPPGMALGSGLTSVRGDRGESYEK